MMKMIITAGIISLATLPGSALAQSEDLQEVIQRPYVSSGLEALELIRSGESEIDQNELFAQLVSRAQAAQDSSQFIESQLLADVYDPRFVEQSFFALPPVEEWPDITTGVRLLVAAAIVDVVDELEEQGVEPTVEAMLQAVGPSMYLMMASSALEAIQAEEPVNYIAVRRGGIRFFSLGWPFCCAQ